MSKFIRDMIVLKKALLKIVGAGFLMSIISFLILTVRLYDEPLLDLTFMKYVVSPIFLVIGIAVFLFAYFKEWKPLIIKFEKEKMMKEKHPFFIKRFNQFE
ncbi:hypothetical protein [Halalkalibacter oceani]|uniref:hypothetical protein n=1 Tax=Halalkalibacter oceani TaxID=1653776 RepID=UPI003391E408